MGRGIVLDKETKRIKEIYALREPSNKELQMETTKFRPKVKGNEKWIPESELKFNVEEAEVGERVDGDKLLKDEFKRFWLYHLGKEEEIAGEIFIRERETLQFDHRLNHLEEEELRVKSGKKVLKIEDNFEFGKEIQSNPSSLLGSELISDERRKFLEKLKKGR